MNLNLKNINFNNEILNVFNVRVILNNFKTLILNIIIIKII